MSVAAVRVQESLLEARRYSWAPLLFVLTDVLALELCLLGAWYCRQLLQTWVPVAIGPQQYHGLALGVLLIPFCYWLLGIYPGYGMNPVERFRARAHAAAMIFSVLVCWDYIVQDRQWSRGILLLTGGLAMLLPPMLEEIVRYYLARTGFCRIPVMILGAGNTGRLVIRLLKANPSLGLHPVMLFDDDPDKWGDTVEGLTVAGPLATANQYTEAIPAAILAIPSTGSRTAELLATLDLRHVIVIPDLLGLQSLWVTTRDIGGVIGLEVRRHAHDDFQHVVKRVLDLALCLPLGLASLPVIALAVAVIKLLSPGPAFYRQEREGLDGRPLRLLKLRTMHPDADDLLRRHLIANPEARRHWESHFKLRHDPRIIPVVGTLLRRFSLDELPQLWHVIRGDMSLVGPRPFPEYHLSSFAPAFREVRRSVLPGLTGLWQVSARGDGDIHVQESLDTYYIRNWSAWMDLHILVHTVRAVLAGRGAY